MIYAISIILAGVYGAVVTYFCNHQLSMGAVRASALISLTGALIPYFMPETISEELMFTLAAIIMGASFIGMASQAVGRGYKTMTVSGIFYGFIFISTGSFFNGFGGSLGTTAAIALGATLGFRSILFRSYFAIIKK